MESFKLNKTKSSIIFSLEGLDSFLHIREITLITNENVNNSLSSTISSIQLGYELSYTVFSDEEGRIVDVHKKSSPIILCVNPNQSHPVFPIDLKIKNLRFTVGNNPIQSCFTELKIELIERRSINQEYELKFDIESHCIKEKVTANC